MDKVIIYFGLNGTNSRPAEDLTNALFCVTNNFGVPHCFTECYFKNLGASGIQSSRHGHRRNPVTMEKKIITLLISICFFAGIFLV